MINDRIIRDFAQNLEDFIYSKKTNRALIVDTEMRI